MLDINTFKIVIENTPLVSIDFIIENNESKYLLGKRVNKPAKGYWFTLGGRIFKNEKIEDAIKRLSKKEFNHKITKEKITFYGTFEHFYDNSFADKSISTHYIVLVYKLKIEENLSLPKDEHCEYNYFSKDEIMSNSYIHKYVKDYFKLGANK